MAGLYAPAVEEYAKRISRYVKFAVEEVPATADDDAARASADRIAAPCWSSCSGA